VPFKSFGTIFYSIRLL